MHPALSIIAFTTLSGLGYGLAAVLGLGLFDPSALATKLAHVAALMLIGAGLMCSTLHLGNPQRAWRALSQWRSSWLSREGVMAIVTFVPLAINAASVVFLSRHIGIAGLVGSVLSLVTVYCTAMIYASLKAIDAWHTRLTPASYLGLSLAGGALTGGLVGAAGGGRATALMLAAILLIGCAWLAKSAWWKRLDGLAPRSTPESATGLGHIGQVKLFERPHINENYLTREMGYRVARKHAAKLRLLAVIVGGVAPAGFVGLALVANTEMGVVTASALAVLTFAFGTLVERWLFFAEARHSVMTYYGR